MAHKHYKRFYAGRTDIDFGSADASHAVNVTLGQAQYRAYSSTADKIHMSATATSSRPVSLQEFEAFQPDIGHINSTRGTKHNLFLQLGKAITSSLPKAYEKAAYSPGPNTSFPLPATPTTSAIKYGIQERTVLNKSDDTLTATQLRAKMPSPTICEDWDDFMAGCRKPVSYTPYQPGNSTSETPGRIIEAATKRRSATPFPRSIPSISVQDAEYMFVDLISPSELGPDPNERERKYSFDENALPDWEIVSKNTQIIRGGRLNGGLPSSLSVASPGDFVIQSGDPNHFARTTN